MLQEVRGDLFLSPSQVLDRYRPADVVVVHSIGLMVHQEVTFDVGHTRDQAVGSVCVAKSGASGRPCLSLRGILSPKGTPILIRGTARRFGLCASGAAREGIC